MQQFRDELSLSHINCMALASEVLQPHNPTSLLCPLLNFAGVHRDQADALSFTPQRRWNAFFCYEKNHKTAFHSSVKEQNTTATPHSILNGPGAGLGKRCCLPEPSRPLRLWVSRITAQLKISTTFKYHAISTSPWNFGGSIKEEAKHHAAQANEQWSEQEEFSWLECFYCWLHLWWCNGLSCLLLITNILERS